MASVALSLVAILASLTTCGELRLGIAVENKTKKRLRELKIINRCQEISFGVFSPGAYAKKIWYRHFYNPLVIEWVEGGTKVVKDVEMRFQDSEAAKKGPRFMKFEVEEGGEHVSVTVDILNRHVYIHNFSATSPDKYRVSDKIYSCRVNKQSV
jgi:hypothetical protein